MDRNDRMIIDLLNSYAFVLHENINDLTDKEINDARNFAQKHLNNSYKWKMYDSAFELFVNKQRFEAITNTDYDLLEKNLYNKICSINNLMNIYDWDFDIYYDIDYEDSLLLSRNNNIEYNSNIDLIYNIKNKSLCKCDIKISDEMYKLGNIYYNYLNYDEIDNINI